MSANNHEEVQAAAHLGVQRGGPRNDDEADCHASALTSSPYSVRPIASGSTIAQ